MIITLTRSGGFTGIPIKKTIDTKHLAPDKAKEIEQIVTTSVSLREGQSQGIASRSNPDRFTYTLTVANEASSHTITLSEDSLSEEMKALIRHLENTRL